VVDGPFRRRSACQADINRAEGRRTRSQ